MDAVTMIKERRSVRKFKEEKVDRKIINEILETTTYSPTWANFQIVRYSVVDNREKIDKIADEGMNDFKHNMGILKNAQGVLVVSNIKGKSGCLSDGEYVTPKGTSWEMFDAGIASQTFCLAAYEKGVGTVIMGIFDEQKIAEIIELPEDQVIAAVIAYGYEEHHPKAPPRKSVEEVVRYF